MLAGTSLQVAGNALTVQASNTYNDTALADGTAVNTATGVAAAVAINRSAPTAEAIISGSVTATTVTVTATVSGQTNVTANSGQGSTTVGVAGAWPSTCPPQIARPRSPPAAASSWRAHRPASVTVQATTTVTQDNATANSKATGFAKTGVGASVALDIAGNGATAEASGTVTSPDEVTVFASGSYNES